MPDCSNPLPLVAEFSILAAPVRLGGFFLPIYERQFSKRLSRNRHGGLNPDNSMESERSPIPGAFDVDPRDPGRA